MEESAVLSKMDLKAFRLADCLLVRLKAGVGSVELLKRAPYGEPFASDKRHPIPAVVRLAGFHGERVEESADCFESVDFYHGQGTPASTIAGLLREGDSLTFEFNPDAHTNDYVAGAGLHADCLYIHIARGGKTRRLSFEIAAGICPSNSARMVRNMPDSDWYKRAQERQRERQA